MKFRFNTHYNTIAAYVVAVFTICLAMVILVFKFDTAAYYLSRILDVLAPVIWGIVIAYLLNPLMIVLEKQLRRVLCRRRQLNGLTRALSIFISVTFLLAVIVGLVYAVIPEILSSLKNILVYLPDYFKNLQGYLSNLLDKYAEKNPDAKDSLSKSFNTIQDYVLTIAAQYQPKLESLLGDDGLLTNITSGAFSFLLGLKDCCLGIIVSIYLLFSKERFVAQMRKTTHAIFSQNHCKTIFRVAGQANYTFMHFLSGKALDSIIIGMLCFIGMTIIDAPYIVLISIIIGITNMIPFFGPFIGAIPSGLLILLSQPDKTLAFVIFILILQQFDGNFLGPKILGNSLGLSPFWIMFSVFLGGGLFGFIGMVAFVPLFAIFYAMFRDAINTALEKKKLPIGSEHYFESGTQYDLAATTEKASKHSDEAPIPDTKTDEIQAVTQQNE